MITLAKLIIGICLTYISEQNESKTLANNYETIAIVTKTTENSVKEKAFEILTNKCNVCHIKRNRRRVFSKDNMDSWAKDVYRQVFIKKRMPKGKKNRLTNQEYQDLLTWISSTKANENGNQF